MEPDETPASRPPSRAEPVTPPSDAELSRIAREAVRQPADPRLDKQLAWMGLTDDPAPVAAPPVAAPPVAPVASASGAVAMESDLARIESRLRRLESLVWVVLVAVAILAAAVVVLLLR